MSFSRIPSTLASLATVSLLAGVASLSGCGMATSTAGTSSSALVKAASSAGIGGYVHGGNQPITGAAITLWAAGVTGTGASNYGANATSVATTTSDSNGNFSFNNPTSGASPCTTGQYLYITATGGNPGLTGTVNNASIALMAAFPQPCGTSTAGTFVTVNEVTTVASVWALQQFMTISSGATPWMIGAPSTNVTGLANAFTEVGTLANITTGVSGATTVTNTVNSVVYSTLIAPDSTKINTLADILATCVNTTGPCTQFFSDVTPSGKTSPTDTLQAAWYIARNPAGLTMASGSGGGSPYYLCNTYVAGAGTPFVPSETCAVASSTAPPVPSDWTIEESWKVTSTAGTATAYSGNLAIDANGNIWTDASSGGTGINEYNAAGQVLLPTVTTVAIPSYSLSTNIAGTTTTSTVTAIPTYTLSYAKAFGIAIDTLGNAWAESYGGATTGTYGTVLAGALAEISPTGATTGYIVGQSPNVIAIDGNNNIYMSNAPVSGRYYLSEMQAPYNNGAGLGTGTVSETYTEGIARSTGYFTQLAIDESANQYVWAGYLTCNTSPTNHFNSAAETSGTAPTPVTTGLLCPLNFAVDPAANAWTTSGGNLYYVNISTGLATPTVTTIAGSTNASVSGTGGVAGLDNAGAIAIDGVGNLWVAGKSSSSYAGFAVLTPTTSGTTTTVVAQTAAGQGQFGFQVAPGVAAGVTSPVIDGSGNVWATTSSGSYLYHLVGAAAPVVTPISLAIKNAAIATLP